MTAPILLATATVLGLLSFFEPCTIATHTLFSARAHAAAQVRCCRDLFGLWFTRSLLTVGLLLLAVTLTTPPAWGVYLPSVALAVMASVYIVSRFVYIPVPHLEFWKLLPRGAHLSQAIKLGATLPACTLPLFLIVTALSVTLDSVVAAIGAGLLFATLFTLPTMLTALMGLSDGGRRFLNGAALATAYITAALLSGAAIYLFF